MIYRVVWRLSYYEEWFDFDTMEAAAKFAETALSHVVLNEDRNKYPVYVTIKVIDVTREEHEKED